MTCMNETQVTLRIANLMARAKAQWNKSQPSGAPPLRAKFDKEKFIPISCNVHP